MDPMIVRLYDQVGTALVIPHPTGIIYSNQAAGTACLQPELEGFLVPIANEVGLAPAHDLRSPENALFEYFMRHNSYGGPLTDGDIEKIESVMNAHLGGGLTVDRDRIKESFESWVFVAIAETKQSSILVDGIPYPVDAVLTWSNSD